jgi:hypothetical protein
MTRIRYTKNGTLLTSNKPVLLPNGTLINIVLDTVTNTYSFVNTSGGATVSTGPAATLSLLKKQVRSTLLELGVGLNVEVKNWNKKQTEVAA